MVSPFPVRGFDQALANDWWGKGYLTLSFLCTSGFGPRIVIVLDVPLAIDNSQSQRDCTLVVLLVDLEYG